MNLATDSWSTAKLLATLTTTANAVKLAAYDIEAGRTIEPQRLHRAGVEIDAAADVLRRRLMR